ncbi:meiosis-specific protein ASY2-like [Brassica napus]|uniref:meiosis-specific protein ASY2-like n=1 Tax=Brassica napus TaxID=3708 RepID=UPI0020786B08|nr:meiosis-specific protein ASY2-like [Brassica napus]
MCLYEAFFTHLRLWFPLPRLLTSYAAARDIVLTQFTLAAMQNVVAALVLGAEVGIDVDLRFFEELANISRNLGTPNTFYINIKSRHDILRGRVNKAHEWFQRYFFVWIDSASVADLNAVLRGTWNSSPKRHPILLPPPAVFSRGVEKIRELGVQQWSDFDRDRIFCSVPRISAGAPSGGRSGLRGRSSSRPPSLVMPCRAARSPSVRTGGARHDIPPYSSVMNDEVTSSSLREENMGMAQFSPLNRDVEPERAFGESGGMNPAAPEGGEPVSVERGASDTAPTGGFMADAIRSDVREGRESRSLKRLSEDVPTEGAPEEKRSQRDPHARVFRYNNDTPFVNDERACAEYFCLPRNAFTDIPDVDNLVHSQEFKDMSRSTAQSNAHAVRLVYLYERDLRRVRAKLEDMFAEKESCDTRIKELEVAVGGLSSSAEVLRAELAASSSREAILRSQIGDQQNALGRGSVISSKVAKIVLRRRAYLDDQEHVKELVFKENQMTGIVSCLEVCIEEGIPIPSEKLRRHRVALREYTDLLDNTEVAALEDDDLVVSPLLSSSLRLSIKNDNVV